MICRYGEMMRVYERVMEVQRKLGQNQEAGSITKELCSFSYFLGQEFARGHLFLTMNRETWVKVKHRTSDNHIGIPDPAALRCGRSCRTGTSLQYAPASCGIRFRFDNTDSG